MPTNEPFSIRRWLTGRSIGWVFLASGLLFLAGGAYQTITGLAHDRSLEQEGRVVDGMVLEKTVGSTIEEGTRRNERTMRTYYSVAFRFSASRSQDITDKVEVDKGLWDRLQVNGPIQVTYLPSEPEIHRVEGQDAEFQLWKLFISVGGAGLMFYVGRLLLAGKLQLDSESESED